MLDFSAIAKGQVGQALVGALLEYAGYRVTRLGIEEFIGEIKYLEVSDYDRLDLPVQLRFLPDLLVAEPGLASARLLEVKYRSSLDQASIRTLFDRLQMQWTYWPGTIVAILLGESMWEGRGYIQDHVRLLDENAAQVFCDSSKPLTYRWESLPMMHDYFKQLLDDPSYLGSSDRLTATIMSMTKL